MASKAKPAKPFVTRIKKAPLRSRGLDLLKPAPEPPCCAAGKCGTDECGGGCKEGQEPKKKKDIKRSRPPTTSPNGWDFIGPDLGPPHGSQIKTD